MNTLKTGLFMIAFYCLLGITQSNAQKLLGNIELSTQGISLGVILNTGEPPKAKEPSLSPVNFSGHDGQIAGFGLGIDASFLNLEGKEEHTILYAPRLSYQYFDTWMPIGVKANLLYYTNFDKGSFTFRPEVGVNLGTNNYLMYGYNLVITNPDLMLTRHQVTLGFTFPKIK